MDINNTTISPSLIPTNRIIDAKRWTETIVVYFLLGTVSMLGYIIAAVGIIKCKQLRSRFFVILGFLAVTRAVMSTIYINIAVNRISVTLGVVNLYMRRGYCYLLYLNGICGPTLETVFLLGLIIDRAMAIVAFKYYRTLTYRHAIVTSLVVTAVTVALNAGASLIGADLTATIECVNVLSPLNKTYLVYHNNVGTVITVIALVLYLALMAYIRFWHLKKLSAIGDRSAMQQFKQQARLLPFLRRTVITHCGLTLLSRLFSSAMSFTSGPVSTYLMMVTGLTGSLDLIASLVVMFASSKELRHASFPRCKTETASEVVQTVGYREHRRNAVRKGWTEPVENVNGVKF